MPQFTVQSSGSIWHYTLSHQRVVPRKHLFNHMGCDFIHVVTLLVKYVVPLSNSCGSVQYLESIVCVSFEAPSCFSPHSFWRGVLVGRSEPNSVPLLLLFQGGRRCEPLKQQEETTGGRSDSHTQTDRQIRIDMLHCWQNYTACSSVQKLGSCKILQEYRNIFNSPYCTPYSFIWMYYNF